MSKNSRIIQKDQIAISLDTVSQYHKWAILLLLYAVCILPFIVSNGMYFPTITGKVLYAWVVIEVAFLLWISLAIYNKEYLPKLSIALALLFIWLVTLIISGYMGVDSNQSFWSNYERMDGIIGIMHWCAYAVMLSAMLKTLREWLVFACINIIIGTLISVLGLIGLLGITPWGPQTPVMYTIGNTLFLAHYLSAIIGIALIVVFQFANKPQIQWLLYASICINTVAIWYTASRSPWIVLFVVVLCWCLGHIWYAREKALRNILTIMLLMLATAAMLFILIISDSDAESDTIDRIQRTGSDSDNSTRTRWMLFRLGTLLTMEKPVWGWGRSNFMDVWYARAPVSSKQIDHTHNVVIEQFVSAGIIGGVTYLGIFALALLLVYKRIKNSDISDKPMYIGVFSVIIGYLVGHMFMLTPPSYLLLFAILSGFMLWMCPAWSIPWKISTIKVHGRVLHATKSGLVAIVLGCMVVSFMQMHTIYKGSIEADAFVGFLELSDNNPHMRTWYNNLIARHSLEYIDEMDYETTALYSNIIQQYSNEHSVFWHYESAAFHWRAYSLYPDAIHFKEQAIEHMEVMHIRAPNSGYTQKLYDEYVVFE